MQISGMDLLVPPVLLQFTKRLLFLFFFKDPLHHTCRLRQNYKMSFNLTWLDHYLAHSDENEQKENILKESCTKFKLNKVQSMVSIGAGKYIHNTDGAGNPRCVTRRGVLFSVCHSRGATSALRQITRTRVF